MRAIVLRQDADTRLVRMQAGQQRCPGGAATGCVVELRKAHTTSSQTVDVRRVDFAAIAADVRKTHVIGHDEEYVGLGAHGGCWLRHAAWH